MNNKKLVILAGGLGTRFSEETDLKPKPMIRIGKHPIIWHIMKFYKHYGINEIIICCGYMGYVIKEYFANYSLHTSDITIDMKDNSITIHKKRTEDWKVTLVDTGDHSMTGGRLLAVQDYVKNDDHFCFTYGDGLSNVNIDELIAFHNSHGKLATMTSVTPPGRFGAVETFENQVKSFVEKPKGDGGRINGGFFVLSPKCIDYIDNETTIWEQEPLKKLAKNNELMSFDHDGFWQPMDTLRDKKTLTDLWQSNKAPWKIWD